MKKFIIFFLCIFLSIFFFYYFISIRFSTFKIKFDSNSMSPEIANGRILTFRKSKKIQRGDIVAYKNNNSNSIFVSRVFGIPGDIVGFDKLYISNNSSIYSQNKTNYIKNYPESKVIPNKNSITLMGDDFVVSENRYFLVCDNWSAVDSRIIGQISKDKIIGVLQAVE